MGRSNEPLLEMQLRLSEAGTVMDDNSLFATEDSVSGVAVNAVE